MSTSHAALARTPEPPYYAVIFSNVRTEADATGYSETATHMEALAKTMPGYLGIESVRDADGVGITVSYWASLDAIRAWRANAEHAIAQRYGREKWYAAYRLRVSKVEREYGFEK